MRCVLRIGWLAIALPLVVGPPATAQETVVLAIEGWRQEVRPDGITYYRCASQVCAAGSVVSYKAQPHRPALTLADFEHHHRALAKQNAGSRNIRAVRIVHPKQRTMEGVRVFQISREVDWADNSTTFSTGLGVAVFFPQRTNFGRAAANVETNGGSGARAKA